MDSNYSGLKPPYKRGALLYKSENLRQSNRELREGETFASSIPNKSNMVVSPSVLFGASVGTASANCVSRPVYGKGYGYC